MKTHIINFLFIIFIGLFSILLSTKILYSSPTSSIQAEEVVSAWLKSHGNESILGTSLNKDTVKSVVIYNGTNNSPVYYIVYLNPQGFVIVSADNLIEPIIGFATHGQYNSSSQNPLGALVTKDMNAREEYVTALEENPSLDLSTLQGTSSLDENTQQWEKYLNLYQQTYNSGLVGSKNSNELTAPPPETTISQIWVPPLVQTTWDELYAKDEFTPSSGDCYNYYTPPNGQNDPNNINYPSGCVATAMAQIMRYWQYPSQPVTTGPFTITIMDSTTGETTAEQVYLRGGNGSGGPYNWSNMILSPSTYYESGILTTTERQAIGAICYDAGVSVNTEYSSLGSGATANSIAPALMNTFGYSNAIWGNYTNDQTGAESQIDFTMINPDLDAGYPVFLSINNLSGTAGHEIICDGYGYDSATLYNHLNMGWSGEYDAWYNLPNITGTGYGFNTVNDCTYNIFPSGTGEIISGRVSDAYGNPLSNISVTATQISGIYTNTTLTNQYGIYAFKPVPSNSGFTINITLTNSNTPFQTVNTGQSISGNPTSGNVWGVNFIPQYPIYASVIGGNGTVSPTTQNIEYGSNASITITPNAGYGIASITDNGISMPITNPYIINSVTTNHNIIVSFTDVFTISASVNGTGGTVVPSTQNIAYGNSANINITPNSGYEIASIIDNGIAEPISNQSGETYIINNVTANHNIVVTFIQLNLTATPGQNGNVLLVWSNTSFTAIDTMISIQRKHPTPANPNPPFITIATIPSNDSLFVDSGIDVSTGNYLGSGYFCDGRPYYYQIVAFNSTNSETSNLAEVTPSAFPSGQNPTDLQFLPGVNGFTVTWNNNTTTETSYNYDIEVWNTQPSDIANPDSIIVVNGTTTPGTMSQTVSVSSGNPWYTQVIAQDSNGFSLYATSSNGQDYASGNIFGNQPVSFNGGGGSCFIATAAFGSYQNKFVWILRQFRNKFLLTNTPGKAFVRWYYKHSPPYADYIRNKPVLKAVVRIFLYPLIFISWLLITGILPYMIFLCAFIYLVYIIKRIKFI